MPDKMSQEKVRLLKAYGAEVVITPTAVPPDHPDNYVMKAKHLVKETPGAILANGQMLRALTNIGLSVGLGLVAVWGGYRLAEYGLGV